MKRARQPETEREPAADAARATLHNRIQTELETHILSGNWHTGFRVPTEKELAEHYGCSRITVSKVLMLLTEKGLVESRKRAGRFVRRPPAQSIILQILDPRSVAGIRGQPYRYEMIDKTIRPADKLDRRRLGLAGRTRTDVLLVTSRHFIGPGVYCYEERLFNLALLPVASAVDFSRRPPGEWIIEYLPWRSGETIIGAAAATRAIAGPLELDEGAPLLTIERHIHANGAAVSWGYAWHPASMAQLTARYQTG
jgi:GntR family histidine utilization transcriptional repressor